MRTRTGGSTVPCQRRSNASVDACIGTIAGAGARAGARTGATSGTHVLSTASGRLARMIIADGAPFTTHELPGSLH